jgi:Cdc6-like AAA superfamily ATPase
MIKTQPSITAISSSVQEIAHTSIFSSNTLPPQKYQTPRVDLTRPFSIYEHHLAETSLQSPEFLWQRRLPKVGITLLDGDHGTGKSLLALNIAARLSSASPMPDGDFTKKAGVIIVTPDTDATTTQLQLLSRMGADLSHIEILSYVQAPTSSPDSAPYRPFSLPEDFSRLWRAVERVNARLIIFDPFISLLSRDQRWTNTRLSHLLADLNQRLIERRLACLLIRDCPAKDSLCQAQMPINLGSREKPRRQGENNDFNMA